MDAVQFARYLEHVDHPPQLSLGPDVASLYSLYRAHVTRFAYTNLDLFMGKPPVDLELTSLLEAVPSNGGHCYQLSELMFAVLQRVGFDVRRVAAWVLMGREYKPEMPLNHNILLVKIGEDTYLCDPGLASTSPRFPIKFNMETTEEVTISQGDHYKLEVNQDHYNFYWIMKDSWFLLFRFARRGSSNWGGGVETCQAEDTRELCRQLYATPEFVPIRDKYVKIALQTNDSKQDFLFTEGNYVYKSFKQGKPVETRTDLNHKQFFQLIKEKCNLNYEPFEIPAK